MNEEITRLLCQESWSPADVRAIRDACAEDERLARSVRAWADLSGNLRKRMLERLPDSRLMVLYALKASGRFDDLLTAEEREEVGAIERRMEDATAAHPAVQTMFKRTARDAEAFDRSWTEAARPARQERDAVRRIRFSAPIRRWSLGLAATLALSIAAVLLLKPNFSRPETMTFEAQPGQTHIVNLSDGSTVRLMDGSTMSYPLTKTFERKVHLEGKAFFDVVPGEQTFEVATANAVTSVHGTSFGVSTDPAGSITEVVLVSGSVSFVSDAAPSRPVTLQPGQSSRVVGDDPPTAPQSVIMEDALAWTNLFIFHDTRLEDAAKHLSDSFGTVVFVDPSLRERKLTGTFAREQGLKEILEAIAAALDVRLIEDAETGAFSLTVP